MAGYLRLSSKGQRDSSDSLASQRKRLQQAGATLFFEDVVSGYRLDQRRKADGYQRLLQAVTAGQVNRLLVVRLDRAARRDSLVLALAETCEKAGVPFESLGSGTVETSTASGWLSVKMQLVMAEHFSRQLSENIRGGYRGLHAQGIPARSAGSLPCHLQRAASGGRHAVEPSPAWKPCRRVIERFLEGRWTLAKAARFMHRTTGRLGTGKSVAAWLRAQHLQGHLSKRDGTVLIESCWPAICNASEFSQIQLRLGTRRRVWGANTTREVRALSGMCTCGGCGSVLAYSVAKRPGRQGVVRNYSYLRCTMPSCPSKRAAVRADLLEQALVVQWVASWLHLLAEAQAAATNLHMPSASLLGLRQELAARETLPSQFRSDADRQRITELQQLIRNESAAPPELDPAVLALLDQRLRVVPIDSGWGSPLFHGQIDAPPGTPWGWFDGRSDQQRQHDLSLLIERKGVEVDTTKKDRHSWIQGVRWTLAVTDERGKPVGIESHGPEVDRLYKQHPADFNHLEP